MDRSVIAPCRAAGSIHGTPRWTRCPTEPLFIVGNEIFDALPFRQFVRHDGKSA